MKENYKRDTEYWNRFYSTKKTDIVEHSLFAEYIMRYINNGCELLDIGCGNGRDSIWFANNDVKVSCIDASEVAINSIKNNSAKTINAICGDFVYNDVYKTSFFDVVYSRFSIHAIDEDQEKVLFSNVFKCLKEDGIFAIEVRGIHDELYKKGICVGRNAYIYEDHYRRFIEINELISKLINIGFTVQYAEENINFAPFMDSNPPIIRVVVKKRTLPYKVYFNSLIDNNNKLIICDGISEKTICDIVEYIKKKKLDNWQVIGTKKIGADISHYTEISDYQFKYIKEIFYTYEVSDKLVYLSNDITYGTVMNYVKTGLMSEEEMLKALLYK